MSFVVLSVIIASLFLSFYVYSKQKVIRLKWQLYIDEWNKHCGLTSMFSRHI